MKWLSLVLTFCGLLMLTTVVWNGRFETDFRSIDAHIGEKGMIVVEKKEGDAEFARVIRLPFGEPVSHLHVRFSYRAVELLGGPEKWQDGRLFVDWMDGDGRVLAHDGLMTCRDTDKKTRSADMIIGSRGNGLFPVLRVEHLGQSGRMEIHSLRAVAVRERGWSVWVVVALVGVWGGWIYGFMRSSSEAGNARVACAVLIVLAMGWFLVVPGPWAHARPLAGVFDTGDIAAERADIEPDVSKWEQVVPRGELPVQGSVLVQIKLMLWFLRPVLHVLMFAGPAFVIVALCGTRSAWWAGLLVSCAVEASQVAFGFGFDWIDVTDLALDWTGIAVGIWMWRKTMSVWKSRGLPWLKSG